MSAEFDYATIPPGYYDQVFHRRRGIQSKWHHMKFARIAALLPTSGRHLDIGCGPGTLVGLAPAGLESVGADLSPQQLAYASGRYPDRRFVAADATRLPFADAEFDVVTVVEMVEHLPAQSVAAVLAEAHRVLRPGGLLVASTPNYAGPWPVIEALVNRLGAVSYEDQHITRFTPASFAAALREAGFQRVEARGVLLAAPFTAPLGWTVPETVARFEPEWLVRRLGLLVLASARKAS